MTINPDGRQSEGDYALPCFAEEWRPVGGYEGLYEVSSEGRVRSLYSRHKEPKVLAFGTDETGYSTVMLSRDGKRKPFTVHRLVALAFHGDKRNALHREVAHLDGSKDNARADNLKWVSKVENESHKAAHGTRSSERFSKLTKEQVLQIKSQLGTQSHAAIARSIGTITPDAVSRIARGERWKDAPSAAAIAELREPPVIGRFYMVPVVTFEWRGKVDTWPVLGVLHHDRELIDFEHLHYHFDGRFLTARQIAYIEYHGRGVLHHPGYALNANVLSETEWRLQGIPRKPTVARRLCKRDIQPWTVAEQAKKWGLAEHYGNPAEAIRRPDGRLLCPHRKTDLSQFTPDEHGIVTCPVHGLRVRCFASADTHPKGGDVKQAPLVSGAVANGETPKGQRHD